MTRTSRIGAAACAALALAIALPTAAQAADLYVAETGSGTLQRSAGGWALVFASPSPRVTVFADRPARTASTQSLRGFVAGWNRAFAGAAPNAALEIAGAGRGRDVALVTLRRPHVLRSGAVRFAVTPLRGTGTGALGRFAKRADRLQPGGFGRASLFIDDGSAASQVGFTLSVSGSAAGLNAFDVEFSDATIAFGGMYESTFTAPQAMVWSYDGASVGGQPQTSGAWSGQANGFLNVAAGATAISGTAQVPAGATMTLQVGNGASVPIPNGAFSVPLD